MGKKEKDLGCKYKLKEKCFTYDYVFQLPFYKRLFMKKPLFSL